MKRGPLSEHSAVLALEQYTTDAGRVAGYKPPHPNRYVEIAKREDSGQDRHTFWKVSKRRWQGRLSWMQRVQMMTLQVS